MFNWLRREAKSVSSRNLTMEEAFSIFTAGARSAAGTNVNTQSALAVTTVLRCATLLGNGCQQIPFKLYQSADDGRTRSVVPPANHPVAKVLSRRPNPWQGPGEFRRTLTMHAALSDFGIALKTRVGGEVRELLPIDPRWVSWKQNDDWSITYRIGWPNGQVDNLGQRDVFILRGPSWDAVSGLSAVKYARDAIGLRMATDESQAKLFKNGIRAPGALVSEAAIPDEEQRNRIVKAWQSAYGGLDNTGVTPLLEGGIKWQELAIKNTDAETIALRDQQVEEICRAFGVFPQLVGHSGGKTPTFASAEQFFIAHVVHTLSPWHVGWEEAVATQLLTDAELDEGYYAKFTVQALLRGTAKERAEYFKAMVGISSLNPNEVRGLEELDARPELDRFQIPANTTVLKDDGTPAPLAGGNKPAADPNPAPSGA